MSSLEFSIICIVGLCWIGDNEGLDPCWRDSKREIASSGRPLPVTIRFSPVKHWRKVCEPVDCVGKHEAYKRFTKESSGFYLYSHLGCFLCM